MTTSVLLRSVFTTIIVIVATTAQAGSPQPKGMAFPGMINQYESSDGTYALINVDPSGKGDNTHKLFLYNKHMRQKTMLMEYTRHVRALWSPRGRTLVITDYSASNASSVELYIIRKEVTRVDILSSLRVCSKEVAGFLQNEHVYLEAMDWLNTGELVLRLRGYGDRTPKSFEIRFALRIPAKQSAARIVCSRFRRLVE